MVLQGAAFHTNCKSLLCWVVPTIDSMEKPKCSGCRAVIIDKKFINCTGCNQKYDLQCANLSPKRYKALNEENKRKWRCQECNSKLPRENSADTPVRSSGAASLSDTSKPIDIDVSEGETQLSGSRVTMRRKPSPCVSYITEDKMKEMLNSDKQEMRAVVESCVNGLSDQLKAIKVQCTGYQESLSFVSKQYDELRKELADFKKLFSSTGSELKGIKDENKALKETMNAQSVRIRALEEENLKQQQWSRIQNIEVTGIPEHKEEDTSQIVLKVAQHIGLSIEPSDIEFAHRVQPRHTTSTPRTSRSIVVRLRQRIIKDRIVAAARKHRNLNAGALGLGEEANRVFINEHLTKENKMLLSSCKQIAREANFKFVWTKNCRIFVRRNEVSPPILIASPSELSKIV